MPGVAQLHTDFAAYVASLKKLPAFVGEPEERKLLLPSEVPAQPRIAPTYVHLRDIEARLCEGQGHDALREIRHYI
jgi:hypothetical protein